MHITGMMIDYINPFVGEVEFRFHKRVNVFIGPNAVGKSTALRGLRWVPSGPVYSLELINDEGGHQWELSVSEDWPRAVAEESGNSSDDEVPAPKWDEVPFIQIPATRLTLIEQTDNWGNYLSVSKDSDGIILADTLGRTVASASSGREDVFDASVVRSIINLLRDEAGGTTTFVDAMNLGYKCAKSICKEIVEGTKPYNYVESRGNVNEAITAKPPIIHSAMGIETIDTNMFSNGAPVYVGNLSAGTQGTLMWVWFLALKMVHHYEFANGWDKRPAILLIDEIENHLHPTWQRRVIPALLEHFPGLQIFATTHSPFVVAGLKAGQVHLLNRDENGVITANPNEQDIIGWTTDEILRTFMGVDDPTDDETAAAARELRQLRDEGPRQEPLDEEQRRERMRELRQLVDRDLLAGGPAAAQEELFEQQFAEALEKYRQSRNLNQENS